MKMKIVCNSNGTLFNDTIKQFSRELEEGYAMYKHIKGIKEEEGLIPKYKRLSKEGSEKELKEHLRIFHEVQIYTMQGMNMEKQPGLDYFLDRCAEEGIQAEIFADASLAYLNYVAEQTGVKERISIRSTVDPELGSIDCLAVDKNEETLNHISDGAAVAYLSHKQGEAELGARAYGLGIWIDPGMKTPFELLPSEQGGQILRVNSLVNVIDALKDYTVNAGTNEN